MKIEAQDQQEQKKRYVKPQLRQINLRPEEAVLGNCKSAAVSGPSGVTCAVTACNTIGS